MELRTLQPGEREALLELLDGWELADGWRGRDFFRRYLEHDPTYRDDHVWVAAEAGRLHACVQIFPRRLRLGRSSAACGGIGSVFTRETSRRRGLGGALLSRTREAMRAAGMELALLFTGCVSWYRQHGFRSVERRGALLTLASPVERSANPGLALAPFVRERDLAAVRGLHERFANGRSGSVLRDDALWEGSLRVAGNPGEEFAVARRAGRLVAYARACILSGWFTLGEWAHEPGAEDDLAALIAALAAPRRPDALAERAGVAPDVRARLLAGDLAHESAVTAALETRGFALASLPDRGTMLAVLEPDSPAANLSDAEFRFWVADRF